jgi:hypothetical protein
MRRTVRWLWAIIGTVALAGTTLATFPARASSPPSDTVVVPSAPGQTVQVTWTEALAEVTMCSTWGWDDTKDQTLSGVTIQIQDGGSGNDKLVVLNNPSLCGGTFHFGTIDLGSPNYVTSNQNFTSSKVAWNHDGTLSFTLGGSATTMAVTDPVTAVYTPDSAMTDTSGNAPQGTASDASSGSQSNF